MWRGNIYFYISVATLIFTFILIFHFYEQRFVFGDFLDAKTIVLALGTVAGAYFGASKAGEHSINLMLEQQKLLKEEKIREQNFEFRKRYIKVQPGVSSLIRRTKYFIDGNIDRSNVEGHFSIISKTYDLMNNVPLELLSIEKFDAFQDCYNAIMDFEVVLEWYKEGIIEVDGLVELVEIRDKLSRANEELLK